jgi:5-methylcytosine-specific restriction endonuclease McrA
MRSTVMLAYIRLLYDVEREARRQKLGPEARRALRQAIHAREGGFCFYCLRRLTPMVRCLDHVVPRVRGGRNGYRNLVSSCAECNSQKGPRRAEDFLRWLYREGRLSAGELRGRLRALAGLAAGKLRPELRRSARSAQPALRSQRDRGKGQATRPEMTGGGVLRQGAKRKNWAGALR